MRVMVIGASNDHAKYGNKAAIPTLKEHIDKVRFPGLTLKAPSMPTVSEVMQQDANRKRRVRSVRQRRALAGR